MIYSKFFGELFLSIKGFKAFVLEPLYFRLKMHRPKSNLLVYNNSNNSGFNE